MRSTFYGFEIAKSGMQASQTGLDVTAENISNVNTEGYTRQVIQQSTFVTISTSDQYLSSPNLTSAQGVNIDSITQVRNQFLDVRYRKENAEQKTYDSSLSILKDIFTVFDETNSDGLTAMMADFYNDLETLTGHAGDVEFSGLVRSSAAKITETLNQYADQLSDIRELEISNLGINVEAANSLVDKISAINTTIREQTVDGDVSPTLLDTRNKYLDDLSQYLNITVEANTDGTVSVKTGNVFLVDAANNTDISLAVDSSGYPIKVTYNGGADELTIADGTLKGIMQVLSGKGTYAAAGEDDYQGLAYYQAALDNLANTFATTFNTLNSVNSTNKPLFSDGDGSGIITAGNIQISDAWGHDANYISATSDPSGAKGLADNITRMIAAMDKEIPIGPSFTGTFEEFGTSLIDEIAVAVSFTSDMVDSASSVLDSVAIQRESVSGVSIDEETVNMIKYQNAYSANARIMTVLDETLDVLINQMGV